MHMQKSILQLLATARQEQAKGKAVAVKILSNNASKSLLLLCTVVT
jgi:hypothetical protein